MPPIFPFSLAASFAAMAVAAAVQQPPAKAPAAPPPAVKVGQQAPDFTLPYLAPKADGGFENKTIRLADFRGKETVILAFFPAAFSPG